MLLTRMVRLSCSLAVWIGRLAACPWIGSVIGCRRSTMHPPTFLLIRSIWFALALAHVSMIRIMCALCSLDD